MTATHLGLGAIGTGTWARRTATSSQIAANVAHPRPEDHS